MRHHRLWLSIGFGLVGLVVYLSLTPHPIQTADIGGIGFGHFLAYFVLQLWFAQVFQRWPIRGAIAVGFVLMGVGLEYLQGMTTYRVFDPADMLDNTLGVGAGLAMAATPLGLTLARLERWMARG